MARLINGETARDDKMNGTVELVNGTPNLQQQQQPHINGEASSSSTTTTPSPIDANTTRKRMARKASNPLAPPFIVSAPGKTIVYGEHAVVHGKAAIAAAISLRSYLHCTTLTKSSRTVTLNFSDIGLDHTWNIPDLPWKAFKDPSRKRKYYDMVTSLDQELVETIQPHIETVSPTAEARMRKVHQDAASAFLYLFLSLGNANSPACMYALRSAVPIGAGLGSSASVSVCMAVALLLQSRALSGPHPDQQSREAEEQLERINRWAFVGELLIHGNPSGVDNTVSTNGHAALFQRKDYAKPPSVSILRHFPELPLLLVDTRQLRSTATEVAKVGELKKKHPAISDHILNAIDAITRSAYDLLTDSSSSLSSSSDDDEEEEEENPKRESNGKATRDTQTSIQHLGELMNLNHGLLATLGVSHPKLERLRHLVAESGVGWLKLTGAGGGGCAIVLLRPDAAEEVAAHLNGGSANGSGNVNGEASSEKLATSSDPSSASSSSTPSAADRLNKLKQQLDEEGFATYTTTLGGDGVGVLYPAVLNDEEIDQETFLAAEGREGIEALVGGKNERDEWKYWRP